MEYNFKLDVKCTIWERSNICIEADSFEEATKIVQEKIIDNSYMMDAEYNEILYDTLDSMTVEQNGGYSTIEIMDEEGTIIFENGLTN